MDLHRWFASQLLGKAPGDVTKSERQLAKACNFGFPGGLGIRAFCEYARTTYGIDTMVESDAARYRDLWLEAFPEMRAYLDDDLIGRLQALHDFTSIQLVAISKAQFIRGFS